ncbi:MAG: hypothetical protein WCW04_00500 [Candidatus Paceibacterota bacterium]
MYYPDLLSLKGNTLKLGDVLSVHNMLHVACCNSLRNLYQDDSQIFKDLGIENKDKFCSYYYKYQALPGEFPLSKEDDFPAMTNLAIALMELSEEKILEEEKKILIMKEYLESEELLHKEITRKKGFFERILGF